MTCQNWKQKGHRGEAAIIQKLSQFSSSWVKAFTFDNGKEFAFHEEVAKALNVKTYFTIPYTSEDKGTVKNRIGVIRRFLPKKTDLRNIRDDEIKWVETTINTCPVRNFSYLSPNQKLKNQFVALITWTQLLL